MGKVYKRASDGRWVAPVSLGFEYNKAGQRVRKRRVFYGKSKREAEIARDDAIAREGGRLRVRPDSGTLGEWLQSWLQELEHTMSPTGYATYKIVIDKHCAPLLAKKRLSALEPEDVVRFYNALRDRTVGPSVIAKCRVVLHRAIEVARGRRIFVGDNPFALVDPPKYAAKERSPLTAAQAQKLIAAAVASGDRHEAAVVLAVACGMRLGEILGLRWGDVDFKAKSISIRRSLQEVSGAFTFSEGKTTTARRKIALGSIALAALRRRKAIAEHTKDVDLVFSTASGTPLGRTNFRKRTFEVILAKAKVPKVRFHDLRHSFATLLLTRGTPVKVAAEALGHANPAITQRLYQHAIGELQKEAINEVDRALRVTKRSSSERSR